MNLEINLAPNINDFQNIPLFSCFPIVVLEHQILEHLNLNLPVPPLKVYRVFRFSFVFPSCCWNFLKAVKIVTQYSGGKGKQWNKFQALLGVMNSKHTQKHKKVFSLRTQSTCWTLTCKTAADSGGSRKFHILRFFPFSIHLRVKMSWWVTVYVILETNIFW